MVIPIILAWRIDSLRPATLCRTATASKFRSHHFQTAISSDDLKQIQGHRSGGRDR